MAACITGRATAGDRGWGQVTVRLLGGASQTMQTRVPLGSPANPLNQEQREVKFHECAANAVRPVGMDTITQSLAILSTLETQTNVQALIDMFIRD